MNYYAILASSPEEQVSALAEHVLQQYTASYVSVLSGPQRGLVMLRVRETVANILFHAGEVLVTEVRIELDGEFGFGMIIGDDPRKALGVALIDAALRKGDEPLVSYLRQRLAELNEQIIQGHQQLYQVVAATKVDFEVI